ncbi:hypothetical protein [Tateyamaria sp. SN3-11]|uniref:hypothetical protein n=1 Tax=Tateyamaria sp. SN3-11 TaxID=3092147 RepID=UPI0039E99CD4
MSDNHNGRLGIVPLCQEGRFGVFGIRRIVERREIALDLPLHLDEWFRVRS